MFDHCCAMCGRLLYSRLDSRNHAGYFGVPGPAYIHPHAIGLDNDYHDDNRVGGMVSGSRPRSTPMMKLLLRQAQDEMLADQLEFGRLLRWLQSLPEKEWVHVSLSKPSPLAFPLFVDRLRERLSSESLEDRLKRMAWE